MFSLRVKRAVFRPLLKKGTRLQSAEKLQDYVKFVIPDQIVGEGCSGSARELLGQ